VKGEGEGGNKEGENKEEENNRNKKKEGISVPDPGAAVPALRPLAAPPPVEAMLSTGCLKKKAL
jgi:hypothetical protein